LRIAKCRSFRALVERVPDRIRKRVLQRPEVFGALADCDDKTLGKVMVAIGKKAKRKIDKR